MFPITRSMTKYGDPMMGHTDSTSPRNQELDDQLEYTYADDPKDGNNSSADESKKADDDVVRNQRLTKSAGPVMSYMRARSKALATENEKSLKTGEEDANSESVDFFKLPWQLLPENLLEDLEFYRNAGKCVFF